MSAAVDSGACDVVGLARPLALHPDAGSELLDARRASVLPGNPKIGLKQLDGAVDLYWHTRQLHRIGAGAEPDPSEPAWRTAATFFAANGWGSFRRKRGASALSSKFIQFRPCAWISCPNA